MTEFDHKARMAAIWRAAGEMADRAHPALRAAAKQKAEEKRGLNMKAVIFDIDGTLADCDHRREHVVSKPKNWKAFNAAMHLDTPKGDIVELLLTMFDADNKIVLCSGREAVFYDQTQTWLMKHGIPYHALYMRAEKDYREDPIVKSELLDEILADGYEPWIVFDDRSRVVDMWRSRGLTCCQVAPGDF